MKFESFAVTSIGDSGRVNQENYLLNGYCKEDATESESFDANLAFGRKDIYAVADGAASLALGEEAALSVVKTLRDFLGLDFKNVQEEFFEVVNAEIVGRIFENNGKKELADTAILYINRGKATVYNIGKSSVFVCDRKRLKKLSGNVIDSVEFEESSIDEDGNIAIDIVEKKTSKFLGADPEKYAICPYISKPVKLSNKKMFLLCTNNITENVSEEELKNILLNKKLKIDYKATEIMEAATRNNSDICGTIVLVNAKRGFNLSWLKSKAFIFIIIAILLSVVGYTYRGVINRYAQSFIKEYFIVDEIDKFDDEVEFEPWTPIVVPDEEKDAPSEEAPVPDEQPPVEAPVQTKTTPQNAPVKKSETKPKPDKNSTHNTPSEPTYSNQPETTVTKTEQEQPSGPETNGDVELPIDFNN